ncbi:hypothetical protein PCORN_14524 [Listeria cornellensis FSL F6-0969]|uniref:CYTH domain-containing protein n=1 Tax=Listeria cornellensis FSL F6-0969 TaxID=1265820 RepID=W7BTZ3_9LIST|nr:hypothetical protein PCORN_14524 [Listeria cornellensis FSL F6-0969]
MSQELEIEFKNMLTASEYDLLMNEFRLEEADFFTQTNYYFDTADFQLKERLAALRIRKRELHYELTLKNTRTNRFIGNDTNPSRRTSLSNFRRCQYPSRTSS